MKLVRQRIWIHRSEFVDSVEFFDRGKLKFYSYTYKARTKGRGVRALVRWDNFQQEPHADKYDDGGRFLEQKSVREKRLADVVKTVKIYRRNLLNMDLAEV